MSDSKRFQGTPLIQFVAASKGKISCINKGLTSDKLFDLIMKSIISKQEKIKLTHEFQNFARNSAVS